MRSRLFSLASCVSLVVGLLIAVVCAVTSFTSEISQAFLYRDVTWEIACRDGALLLDNEPQRDLDTQQLADADFHAHVSKNAERAKLSRDIDEAPYGEAYRTATDKLADWDKSHAGSSPTLVRAPTSAAIEYRVHLLWLVSLFSLFPLSWLVSRIRTGDPAVGRAFFLIARTAILILCVLITAAWAVSYRKPINFFLYTVNSAYHVMINRGHLSVGRPPAADPAKFAAVASIASQMRNSDIVWTLGPSPLDARLHRVQHHQTLQMWPDIVWDSQTQRLGSTGDYNSILRSCLRALHDRERFQAAHVLLIANARHVARPQPFSKGHGGWDTHFMRFLPADLKITLTSEQQSASQLMTFTPQFNAAARAGIERQWHQAHDRYSQPLPLWPAITLLFFLSIRSVYVARQTRRRVAQNLCLACEYNLTGNTSGVCPECGNQRPLDSRSAVVAPPLI